MTRQRYEFEEDLVTPASFGSMPVWMCVWISRPLIWSMIWPVVGRRCGPIGGAVGARDEIVEVVEIVEDGGEGPIGMHRPDPRAGGAEGPLVAP